MSSEGSTMNALEHSRFLDSDRRWQAVLNRDQTADGDFYYAVRSTGIYCRPTCAARRPKRENVLFFADPEAAERAGFRACRRCQPDEVSSRQATVLQAQQILEAADRPPTLSELGRAVGFSPFHLQRLFKQATGLSPAQYAAAHRLGRFKSHLAEGSTVTEATYAAGYGSSRAAYQSSTAELGMSPGVYRKGGQGQRIAYAVTNSPLGRMLVAATERGLSAVRFGEHERLIAEFAAELPRASLICDPAAVEPHVQAVREHLEGRRMQIDILLDPAGTAFQQRVWSALRQIPYGETRTYSQVAEMIGQPRAARAVARACALNPIAVAVPCHRVIRSSGKLAGYRWGIERKQALLDREQAILYGEVGTA
jgi:AraC family transcriptional regulator of adaptative response/methylated-DNA-[protein]-cysteine methyltransferase